MVERKSILFVTVMCFLLCGCAKPQIQYVEKPVYVEVPVLQKIEVEPIKKPVYHIKKLTKDSSPNEIAEAYVNTIKELNAYTKKMEMIVEPFYIKR